MLFGGLGSQTTSTLSSTLTSNNNKESAGKKNTDSSAGPPPGNLFWVDHGAGTEGGSDDDGSDDDDNIVSKNKHAKTSGRAWKDDADEDLQVNLAAVNRTRKLRKTQEESVVNGADYQERLREQFNRANAHTGASSWAAVPDEPSSRSGSGSDDDDDDDDDDDNSKKGATKNILQSTASVIGTGQGGPLPPSELRVLRLKDANAMAPSGAAIQSVQFMRRTAGGASTPLLLTAGYDKTLRLFSIDGKKNKKVQSVFVRDFPIHHAEFAPTSDEIILSSRRSHFYVYNLQAAKVTKIPQIVGRDEKSLESFTMSPDGKYITFLGNDGYAVMVDRKTKRWLFDVKMNGSIRTCSYGADGTSMYTSGSDGQVYLWDLRTRQCVDRHTDEGCVRATALASSPSGSGMYACGADSGVVNLYKTSIGDRGGAMSKQRGPLAASLRLQRTPFKSIMSLTTKADTLKFNHDGQILAIASQMKKDSLRLVHANTGTVFANWPTGQTPLRYVTDVDFSPSSGLFAIGNDRGKVLLYRLLHYART